MDTEIATLRVADQRETGIMQCCVHMESVKSYRKELVCKTETDSQTYGRHRGKVEGKEKLGVWD